MVRGIPRSFTLITTRPGLDIGEHAAAVARCYGVPPWAVPNYRGTRVLTVYWEWTEPDDQEPFTCSGRRARGGGA
jgi:hypothetical protein